MMDSSAEFKLNYTFFLSHTCDNGSAEDLVIDVSPGMDNDPGRDDHLEMAGAVGMVM